MQVLPVTTGIVPFESIFSNQGQQTADESSGAAFSEIFTGLIDEVTTTNQQVKNNALRMMNGEIEDLHTLYNDMTKAQLAVETFVAVKNAAVSGYQQIAQMQM
ncbi:MAG: flagellar hook-basal body complex protein FliE [Ruminococcus sp.]|jgi:flagellar hook-basal body complex protein FliE|nr:flagellar hook-basal body complex protein FliE [Ruminococcus sp.]